MSLFQSILKSIKEKLKEQSSFKENIAEVLSNIIKTKIKPSEIKIKQGVLTVFIHPTIKSTILFKKEEIKSKLKDFGVHVNTIN